MNENRFKLTTEEDICYCEYTYWKGDEPLGMEEVVDLLNEQQAIIEHLTVEKFKENKRFTKLLSEQQATIRKLQDLCGESDGENAKLRIENKRLCDEIKLLKPTNIEQYEQIVRLQEENEKLQKDLYIVQTDCKNAKESKEHWRNKAKELEEKNKQIGFLKRDLYTIIRDTKETPFGNSITMTKIRERWE